MNDDINYKKKILTYALSKVFHNYYNNHNIAKDVHMKINS